MKASAFRRWPVTLGLIALVQTTRWTGGHDFSAVKALFTSSASKGIFCSLTFANFNFYPFKGSLTSNVSCSPNSSFSNCFAIYTFIILLFLPAVST